MRTQTSGALTSVWWSFLEHSLLWVFIPPKGLSLQPKYDRLWSVLFYLQILRCVVLSKHLCLARVQLAGQAWFHQSETGCLVPTWGLCKSTGVFWPWLSCRDRKTACQCGPIAPLHGFPCRILEWGWPGDEAVIHTAA